MTVSELRALLQQYHPDAPVILWSDGNSFTIDKVSQDWPGMDENEAPVQLHFAEVEDSAEFLAALQGLLNPTPQSVH